MVRVKCVHCKNTIGCKSALGWFSELCENCIENKTNTCLIKDCDAFDTVEVFCKDCLNRESAIESEQFWSKR